MKLKKRKQQAERPKTKLTATELKSVEETLKLTDEELFKAVDDMRPIK